MSALRIRETYTNETKGYRFHQSEWYEPYTDDYGKLFRSLQREYGRCASAIYVDTPSGPRKVGWYFEKSMQYEDTADYYTRGVWVEIDDPAAEEREREKEEREYEKQRRDARIEHERIAAMTRAYWI